MYLPLKKTLIHKLGKNLLNLPSSDQTLHAYDPLQEEQSTMEKLLILRDRGVG
jgi:hypothetical protein